MTQRSVAVSLHFVLGLSLAACVADPVEEPAVAAASAVTTGGVAIGRGSVWRYRDDGVDLGTGWRAAGYDDSAFRSGPAPLGYGDPGIATAVRYGADPTNKHVTTYFRRAFTVADASAIAGARLSLRRDDGAVVHVNGVEVARSNMPAGAIGHRTLASVAISGGEETSFTTISVPASVLVTGTNVVAVEVHQASVASSDLAFDLELVTETRSACGAASTYGAPVARGTVSAPAIVEASGLAASVRNAGVLYTHNDSGDGARFFALDTTARLVGTFSLTGATAQDWEDVAVGPCPAGSCLYIGDIGDNGASRTNCAVLRVPEPNIAGGQTSGALAAERLPFAYPDGPRDAETVMVHPRTGDVYVVSKSSSGRSRVYRFPRPLQPNVKVTLIKVAEIQLPTTTSATATGGAIHPCADRLLLRTYSRVYELRAPDGAGFEAAFGASPIVVPSASERQGEAITYAPDGRSYFTLSEGSSQALYRVSGQ